MITDRNIICISSIDWNFIWQGHQEIMSTFAKNGNRVLFIENTGARAPGLQDMARIKNRIINWSSGVKGIRKVMDNLYVYSPLVMPFPYLRIARRFNRRMILTTLDKWTRAMDFYDPVIWVFLPTPLTLDIIEHFDSNLVVYYCIDNFIESSAAAKKIRKSEISLLKMADLVFVTSHALERHCSPYSSKTIHVFPFAVNFEIFEKKRRGSDGAPDDLKIRPRPVIGYIGGLHKWIDFDLIAYSARRYPEYSFVFVGPVQTDVSALEKIPNIFFLGKKEHSLIPDYIAGFDVCIIPYLITAYTRNVYPTKLNEYLAMGRPVVSTDLPEIDYFNSVNNNVVLTAKTREGFCDAISMALGANAAADVERRIAIAKTNSWSSRIEQMSGLMEEVSRAKKHRSFDWKARFMNIYRHAERRMSGFIVAAAAVYLMIFYTPVVWFLASPLKISTPLQKADAIVVLAGGVGESGQPGQGYEERVEYAVNLYKKGYASRLIFSSGFMYALKEPLVMKALAISLGVPDDAIILEDQARSTYEHVLRVRDVLHYNRLTDIVLISSPYHMLRLSLVMKKFAPDIRTIYAPVPNSLFYQRIKGPKGEPRFKKIESRQLKALIHEYTGLLYYWFTGRI